MHVRSPAARAQAQHDAAGCCEHEKPTFPPPALPFVTRLTHAHPDCHESRQSVEGVGREVLWVQPGESIQYQRTRSLFRSVVSPISRIEPAAAEILMSS